MKMLAATPPPPVNVTITSSNLNEKSQQFLPIIADKPAKSLRLKPVDVGIQCGFA